MWIYETYSTSCILAYARNTPLGLQVALNKLGRMDNNIGLSTLR
jgi:hypothetical protein